MAESHFIGQLFHPEDEQKVDFMKMRADSLSCPPSTMDSKAPSSPLPLDQFFIVEDPSYVREYQEKKNLNPRLPKPIPAFVFPKAKQEMSLALPNLDMKYSGKISQQAPQNSPPRDIISNDDDWGAQQDDEDGQNNNSVVDRIQQQFPRTPSPVYKKMNEPIPNYFHGTSIDANDVPQMAMGIVSNDDADVNYVDRQEEGEDPMFMNDQAVDSLEMHMRKLSMGGDLNGDDADDMNDMNQEGFDDLQNGGMDYLSDKNPMKQYGMMNNNGFDHQNQMNSMHMGMNMNAQQNQFNHQHGFIPSQSQIMGGGSSMPSIPQIPTMQYNPMMGMNSQMMAPQMNVNGMPLNMGMTQQSQPQMNMRMMNKSQQRNKMFSAMAPGVSGMPGSSQGGWGKQVFMVPPPPVANIPQSAYVGSIPQPQSYGNLGAQNGMNGVQNNYYGVPNGQMMQLANMNPQNMGMNMNMNMNQQSQMGMGMNQNNNKKYMNQRQKNNHNNSNNNNNNGAGNSNNNTNNNNTANGAFGSGAKSKLMEDFKQGKKIELGDIKGHVVEFSRDQYGSRFIQKKLEDEELPPADQHLVFQEILPEALSLMTDVFGNYVIQKFFENGTSHQKKQLVKVMKGHVLALTLQTYGCRVIQKALDKIDDEDKYLIAQELDGHVMRCIQDQNGNHVIQKCIETIPQTMVRFIVDSFEGQVQRQATHSYGCRVIQRILENCPEQTDKIMDEVVESIHQLVRDPYGNYVVQHVLQKGLPKHKSLLIKTLKPKIAEYSFDKYASNVIEGCFTNGSKKERTEMIQEIVAANKDFSASPLLKMMNNQYANYVIQKIIEISDPQQRKMLFDRMKPNLVQIRKLAYGKHVIAKMESMGLS